MSGRRWPAARRRWRRTGRTGSIRRTHSTSCPAPLLQPRSSRRQQCPRGRADAHHRMLPEEERLEMLLSRTSQSQRRRQAGSAAGEPACRCFDRPSSRWLCLDCRRMTPVWFHAGRAPGGVGMDAANAVPCAATVDSAISEHVLSDRERDILAFERQWWKYAGAKEQAIRELFDMSGTRYYQVLNALLDRPEALVADPMLVKRLRRLRSSRRN